MTQHRHHIYDRSPLVAEHPDLVVTDPVTGVAMTCRDLRDRTEACFRDAYAELRPLREAGDYDLDLVLRSRLGPCWGAGRDPVVPAARADRVGISDG